MCWPLRMPATWAGPHAYAAGVPAQQHCSPAAQQHRRAQAARCPPASMEKAKPDRHGHLSPRVASFLLHRTGVTKAPSRSLWRCAGRPRSTRSIKNSSPFPSRPPARAAEGQPRELSSCSCTRRMPPPRTARLGLPGRHPGDRGQVCAERPSCPGKGSRAGDASEPSRPERTNGHRQGPGSTELLEEGKGHDAAKSRGRGTTGPGADPRSSRGAAPAGFHSPERV